MNIPSDDFLSLLQECEDKCEDLRFFNPNHHLLQFSNRFISLNHYQILHQKILEQFLPECSSVKNAQPPHFEEVMSAYGHFHVALEAALALEVAKTWSLQTGKTPT